MNKSTIFADILCKDLTSESFFSFVENQGMFNINGLNWCRLSLYCQKKIFFGSFIRNSSSELLIEITEEVLVILIMGSQLSPERNVI